MIRKSRKFYILLVVTLIFDSIYYFSKAYYKLNIGIYDTIIAILSCVAYLIVIVGNVIILHRNCKNGKKGK